MQKNKQAATPCPKLPPLGQTQVVNQASYQGLVWTYAQPAAFDLVYYDLFIKEDSWANFLSTSTDKQQLLALYLMTGSGEILSPYQGIGAQATLLSPLDQLQDNLVLHGSYPFRSLGIRYHPAYLESRLPQQIQEQVDPPAHPLQFLNLSKSLGHSAKNILSSQVNQQVSQLYYDSLASHWISLLVDELLKLSQPQPISPTDQEKIAQVARYIEDHYNIQIRQEVLEKISLMSKTKLKASFKQIYGMSITEYIQRKRMNFAENLLLSSSLSIQEIARSVGYQSHSRFSQLYKRYKGTTPRQARAFQEDKEGYCQASFKGEPN